jgi:hypothetical protein
MSNYQKDISNSTTLSLSLFVVTTIIYTIVKIFTYNSKSDDAAPAQKYIWEVVYILIIISSQLMVNVNLSQIICGKRDFKYALSVTVLPWIIIFGTLNIILIAFPGWLSPFSNTIGYLFAKLSGAVDLLKKDILKVDVKGKNEITNKVINYIYNDPSLLLNEVSNDNFDLFWDKMNDGDLLKQPSADENKGKLKYFIEMKTSIAQGIWYLLTGSLVTSITYNNIVNNGCETSVEEQQKRAADYQAQKDKIKGKTPNATTYTTDGS